MIIYDSYLAMRETDFLRWVPTVLLLLSIFVGLISLMGIFSTKDKHERTNWGIVCFVAGCVLLFSALTLCAFTPRYQVHKAVITDSSALPEILENYEIVDQEGQILTLKAWEAYDFSEDEP